MQLEKKKGMMPQCRRYKRNVILDEMVHVTCANFIAKEIHGSGSSA